MSNKERALDCFKKKLKIGRNAEITLDDIKEKKDITEWIPKVALLQKKTS